LRILFTKGILSIWQGSLGGKILPWIKIPGWLWLIAN